MAWIFQGNRKRFDVDDYLSRYTQLIYWTTNRARGISLGDPVFIWRAGVDAGVVAVGHVVETPTPARSVKHPEALGDDLWVAAKADPDERKTGIRLHEIRLTREDGMVPRSAVKKDRNFGHSKIITVRTGTVFRLSPPQLGALENLWGSPVTSIVSSGATEGQRRLRAHYARERSPWLREHKLQAFRMAHGRLYCELCRFESSAHDPAPFTDRAFEVHHKNPLAKAASPVRTTLDDLAVLCANCHRAVHANANVPENYSTLAKLYAGGRR